MYFTDKKSLLNIKKREKMIGHHARLQENDDFPLWQAPAIKRKLRMFFNMHALITHEIIHSKDVQCNTKE